MKFEAYAYLINIAAWISGIASVAGVLFSIIEIISLAISDDEEIERGRKKRRLKNVFLATILVSVFGTICHFVYDYLT